MLQNIVAGFADFFQNIKYIRIKFIFFQSNVATADASCGNTGNRAVVIVYQNNVIINSGKAILDHVEVYDISGRLLASAKKIKSNEVSINVGETNQVLIVKITSTDGITVNKKTIN